MLNTSFPSPETLGLAVNQVGAMGSVLAKHAGNLLELVPGGMLAEINNIAKITDGMPSPDGTDIGPYPICAGVLGLGGIALITYLVKKHSGGNEKPPKS